MAVPIVLSPETDYATRTNIKFPGTKAQAEAAAAAADARIEDVLPNKVKIEVPSTAITPAT